RGVVTRPPPLRVSRAAPAAWGPPPASPPGRARVPGHRTPRPPAQLVDPLVVVAGDAAQTWSKCSLRSGARPYRGGCERPRNARASKDGLGAVNPNTLSGDFL